MDVDTLEKRVSAGMELEESIRTFYDEREKLYRKRDAAIIAASQVLPQKDVATLSGLHPETIRQITKGHAVSWRPRASDGQ